MKTDDLLEKNSGGRAAWPGIQTGILRVVFTGRDEATQREWAHHHLGQEAGRDISWLWGQAIFNGFLNMTMVLGEWY